MKKPSPKTVPEMKTDHAAQQFLRQDLSALDFSRFRPVRFEFEKKEEQVNLRIPKGLLDAVKARAKARNIPYARLIRETLELVVAGPEPRRPR
jgi:predicted DNA binding CopG/RHH family protein